jgi:hypothetical protein
MTRLKRHRAPRRLCVSPRPLRVKLGSVPACTTRPLYPQEQTSSGGPACRLVPKQASTGGVGFHVAGRATVRRRLAANLRLVWRPDLAAGSGSDLEGAIRYGGGRWCGMPLAPRIVVYADAARRQLPK